MFVDLVHANIALVLATLSGIVIPYLSALATKAPTWATGAVTAVLAAVAGFVGEWAASADADSYDWRKGLTTAASALFFAFLSHKITLSGTTVQSKLHATGNSAAQG
jgi:hypothetical protein